MEKMSINQENFSELEMRSGLVFTPATPINQKNLFAGRQSELNRAIDVILSRGQHGILYGERGVGKTSLAETLHQFLVPIMPEINLLVAKVNCEAADDFDSVWRKVLQRIKFIIKKEEIGFGNAVKAEIHSFVEQFKDKKIVSEDIRKIGESGGTKYVFIFDEFDRMNKSKVSKAFSDAIKNLSDYGLDVTIILVGVAESINVLIKEHESIGRCLIQIRMPRMKKDDLKEILTNGFRRLDSTISEDVATHIINLSQGLPHYTHLLGKVCARAAFREKRKNIIIDDLRHAIKSALEDSQHSTTESYLKAVRSQKKYTWFKEVLLAAALVKKDDLSFFTPSDVAEPLKNIRERRSKLKGSHFHISAFVKHLSAFCQQTRGCILRKEGEKRRYRYCFSDPLMPSYVILKSIAENIITEEDVEAMVQS